MNITSHALSLGAAFCLITAAISTLGHAETTAAPEASPSKVDPEALKRWQEDRFGLFIHWGPISQLGKEIGWARGHREITNEMYDDLYKTFNPENFDADAWVSLAKQAGMKYIVLVAKHHDGFCLWDTKQIDYNIMNSPFKRDIVKELAEACKKQDMDFGCYYSTLDWWHKDFPMTGRGGNIKRETSDLEKYTDYLKAQIRELLTNYGPLVTLWFDRPQCFDAKRGQSVIDMARSIQPDVLINNRTGAPGDYLTPEQKIGKFDRKQAWEACMTVSKDNHWGWHKNDGVKPLEKLIEMLVQSAGGDGNLLLNIGPMADGTIDPEQAERLEEIGEWMKVNGESIYATRGGPYKPGQWGAATCKGNTMYLLINKFDENGVATFPPLERKILSSKLLAGGESSVKQDDQGVTVTVPAAARQEIVTVVKLELDGPAFDIEPIAMPVADTAQSDSGH